MQLVGMFEIAEHSQTARRQPTVERREIEAGGVATEVIDEVVPIRGQSVSHAVQIERLEAVAVGVLERPAERVELSLPIEAETSYPTCDGEGLSPTAARPSAHSAAQRTPEASR